MSEKYPEYPYTNFPEQIDNWEDKMDITSEMYGLVVQYKQYCNEGRFFEARKLLETNSDLQKMVIDAMSINELRHAVMAIEKMWSEDLRDYVVKRVFDSDINIGEYTHTYNASTKVHNFTGTGRNARVFIVDDYHKGDSFALNGSPVSAYMGGAGVSNLFKNQYMYFFVNDNSDGIYFIGGGDTSNLMPKSGGTFTGSVNFANDTTYNIDGNGDSYLKSVSTKDNIAAGGNITATGTITGSKVYGAVYNDYAEFFPRGEETEAGDIIALDTKSEDERYIKAVCGMRAVGIHSEEYSHIIGGENADNYIEHNMKNYIPVGLVGRCHCKVLGEVHKGDYITTSNLPGVGIAVREPKNVLDIVGIAVEDKLSADIGKVKIKISVL